jgi:hypothetical protein
LKKKNPSLIIGVGGCMAQQEGEKLFQKVPFINIVFGTQSINKLSELVKTVEEKKSTALNISMGGILFASKKPVRSGAVIMLKMPFQNKVFNVRAKVVHCDKSPETSLYNIGASFHRLSAAYKVKLIEQLYLISEFRDLRSIQLGREVTLEKASREWIKRYSARFRRLYW